MILSRSVCLLLLLVLAVTTAKSPRHWRHRRHKERLAAVPKLNHTDSTVVYGPSHVQRQTLLEQPPPPQAKGSAAKQEARRSIRGFTVLHDDPFYLQALQQLLHHTDSKRHDTDSGSSVWLYGELPKWNLAHAHKLWDRVCGHPHELQHNRFRFWSCLTSSKHSAATKKGDTGVSGFGIDLNLLASPFSPTPCYQDLVESKGSVHLVALVPSEPGHLVLECLRQVCHENSTLPMSRGIPGRLAGVSRSAFGDRDRHHHHRPFRHRHLHTICPPHTESIRISNQDTGKGLTDPTNLIRLLKRAEASHTLLTRTVERLREAGVRVLEIDPQHILTAAESVRSRIHDFLFGGNQGSSHTNQDLSSTTTQGQAPEKFGIPAYVIRDCAHVIETARVRLAVDVGKEAAGLIHDLTAMRRRFNLDQSDTQVTTTKDGRLVTRPGRL